MAGATCHQVLAQDDIELTDSTSTNWEGTSGGSIAPGIPSGSVTSLQLSRTSLTLDGGMSARLVATVNNDAANKTVCWNSTNETIATVSSSGVVTAWRKGTAMIVAVAVGNTSVRQTCTVTVTSDATILIGDANGDGDVNIADVTALINYLNGVIPASFSAARADVNGDGMLNIADVTGIINIINQ